MTSIRKGFPSLTRPGKRMVTIPMTSRKPARVAARKERARTISRRKGY